MNEILKDKLRVMAEDTVLLDALETVFNVNLNNSMPNIDSSEGDDIVGQKYRAYTEAKKIINKAFADIKSYKQGNINKKSLNRAN